MKESVKRFSHPEIGDVRVVIYDGKWWFVAYDVANCLGYCNATGMCHDLKRGKNRIVLHSREVDPDNLLELRKAEINLITEEGVLYIIKNRKHFKCQSEPFEVWLKNEILPALHKTGDDNNRQPILNLFKQQSSGIEVLPGKMREPASLRKLADEIETTKRLADEASQSLTHAACCIAGMTEDSVVTDDDKSLLNSIEDCYDKLIPILSKYCQSLALNSELAK